MENVMIFVYLGGGASMADCNVSKMMVEKN